MGIEVGRVDGCIVIVPGDKERSSLMVGEGNRRRPLTAQQVGETGARQVPKQRVLVGLKARWVRES
ncbi:hypothetical protein ACJ72_08637 [Emergomyces africanus]|uniref:Uncharacterized protein n=1 Tax=Emergomyces africanus TaxID=1955775 RepID=A0A1B7NJU1_9EURO|nr:hypothetical protein ACJ72_08637 [Emergomyces africanus]